VVKRGLSKWQLTVLDSLMLNGKQNIQEIQLSEGMNYATTNRSVKILERLSFVWMSNRNKARGPKGAQTYSVTPLGVVEALLRGEVQSQIIRVVENWGEVAPRFVHHWTDFVDAGLGGKLWRCLWWLYPERVVINRIVPLHVHEAFQKYIKPNNFPSIKDGLDEVLLDISFTDYGISIDGRSPFIKVVSSDPEYLRVWFHWFSMEENKFKHIQELNEIIKSALEL
jgi:hypothetical protein